MVLVHNRAEALDRLLGSVSRAAGANMSRVTVYQDGSSFGKKQAAREGGAGCSSVLPIIGVGQEGFHRPVRRPGEQHHIHAWTVCILRKILFQLGGAG